MTRCGGGRISRSRTSGVVANDDAGSVGSVAEGSDQVINWRGHGLSEVETYYCNSLDER